MPPRSLFDQDKYYPGSPWGDRPPQEVVSYSGDFADPRVRNAPVVSITDVHGLRGPIVERDTAGGPLLHVPRDALPHIDAYFEYYQMVGESDNGRLMGEAEFEAMRQKAADPCRRVWVHWVEVGSGLECKAMGPSSMCFCEHRYREHGWAEYPETHQLSCKMAGCPCAAFSYVPVRGSGDVKCSSCRQSFRDHDKRSKACRAGKGRGFTSSYSCSCNSTYDKHKTVIQTNAERETAGKSTGTPWMGEAAASGLPTAHLGGIGGFTSLADGIDRALAGVEPGFEPQRVYDALSGGSHGISGLQGSGCARQGPGGRSTLAMATSPSGSVVRSRTAAAAKSVPDGRRNTREFHASPVGSARSSLPNAGRMVARSGSPAGGRGPTNNLVQGRRPISAGVVSRIAASEFSANPTPDLQTAAGLQNLSVGELRALARQEGIDLAGCKAKSEIVDRLRAGK